MTPWWFPRVAALLGVPALLAAAACASGSATAPAATSTPAPTAAPTRTAAPTATPSSTPIPDPVIDSPVAYPRQGGFLLVRLTNPPPGAQQVTALFNGESYTMVTDGEARLAVIGLATDLSPGDYAVDVLAEGEPVGSVPVAVTDGGFAQLTLTVSEETYGLLSDAAAIEAERRAIEEAYATFTPERLWSGGWLMPVQGPISNAFGVQRSVNGGPFDSHGGTDIVADGGTAVVAAGSGRVVLARPLYLLGNSVIIDHGAGMLTGYHHMSSIAVEAGQEITKGDLVGFVGTTGFSSGNHLHWEARIHGVKVDATLLTRAPLGE